MPFPPSRGSLALALAALGLLGVGCSPLDSAKKEVEKQTAGALANKAVETLTGGRLGVNATGGQVTFTDKGTGTGYTVGERISIPADFPKDMLVYPNAKVLALTTGKEPSINVQAEEPADKVVAWYADKLGFDGWKEASRYAAGGYEARTYAKGAVTLSFTFFGSRENEAKYTVVHLTRTEK